MRPSNANFIDGSIGGRLSLSLSEQEYSVAVLMSGVRSPVECSLDVLDPESPTLIASLYPCMLHFLAYMSSPFAPRSNMKAEGLPNMKKTPWGSMTQTAPCSNRFTLWYKRVDPWPYSFNVPFSVALPTIL